MASASDAHMPHFRWPGSSCASTLAVAAVTAAAAATAAAVPAAVWATWPAASSGVSGTATMGAKVMSLRPAER